MKTKTILSTSLGRMALPSFLLAAAAVGAFAACSGEFKTECPEGTVQQGGGDVDEACVAAGAGGSGGEAGTSGTGGTGAGGTGGSSQPPPKGDCQAGQKQCSAEGLSECGPDGQWQAPAACEIGCDGAKTECVVPVQLAAGSTHACALLSDGTVRCWGDNSQGQLGSGTGPAASKPQPVPGLSGVKKVSTNYDTTCAISDTKEALCWGSNISGMLTAEPKEKVDAPLKIADNAVDISTGRSHLCYATDQNDQGSLIRCRGRNYYAETGNGQAGYDTQQDSSDDVVATFVNTQNFQGLPKAIEAGDGHTCAFSQSNEAFCWGNNGSGQIGVDRATFPLVKTATRIGRENLADTIATSQTSCALETGGKVACWGFSGFSGMLGRGDSLTIVDSEAQYVVNLAAASRLSGGQYHICAVTTVGEVWCWGLNTQGQLGKDCSASDIQCEGGGAGVHTGFPTRVPLPEKASTVSAGAGTCALLFDNSVHCWGPNDYGQLGTGKVSPFESSPQRVAWK